MILGILIWEFRGMELLVIEGEIVRKEGDCVCFYLGFVFFKRRFLFLII